MTGSVTDGVTQSVGSSVTLSILNNYLLEEEDAQVVTGIYGESVLQGTPIDGWELNVELNVDSSDPAYPGYLEFGVIYISLDTAMYSNLDFRGAPPWAPAQSSGDADKVAAFYIAQIDQFDNTVFYALGTLDEGALVDPDATFSDVPSSYWAYSFIETLAASGITSGCSEGIYCPSDSVTRAQMAIFLERGMNGSGFSPPAATGNVFFDVSAESFAASFIEQLASDGITSGCGSNNYCPTAEVTRAQMAVFLLKAKYGSGYFPPPATGIFDDVPLSHWAVAWIEQLAAEGITSGCAEGMYCPEDSVTRAQMAVFLVRAFDL